MKHVIAAVLLVVLVCLGAASMSGQAVSTASITGNVKDATGAVIPGAQIQATQTETGAVRTTVSGADGSFNLNPLPLGPYRIEVTKDGFTSYVQQGIVLQVGSSPLVNPVLQVGSASEKVLVEASVNMVETQQSGVGQVISEQSIVDLPLNGRQATQLITLSGATAPSLAGELNTSKNYPTVVISVAGGNPNGLTFLLDGANYNDSFNNLNLPLPNPDALQEFKVETNALPAQYGYHATGAVNAVTREGTNSFHGTVFDFARNGFFNARDDFATMRDALKRNQFGGTAGGPIIKDKLFFFGAYQGTIVRTAAQASSFVPTPGMIAGTNAACLGAGFAAAQTTQVTNEGASYMVGGIDPMANAILKYLPTPNGTTAQAEASCGNVTYPLPANYKENQITSKVNYTVNSKHSLFVRDFWTRYTLPPTYKSTNALPTTQSGLLDTVDSLAIGDTYIFSQNLINQFRVEANRITVFRTIVPFFTPADLEKGTGAQGYIDSDYPGLTNLTVTGGFGLTGPATNPGHFNTTTPQLSDDVLWTWGKHQFGFGMNWIHEIANTLNTQQPNGQTTVSASGSGGTAITALGNFLLGNQSNYIQGNYQIVRARFNYTGYYALDTWKVTPKLTVSYGIRWEPFFPPATPNGFNEHFSMADYTANVMSTVYPNAPAGFSYPGDSNFTPKRNSEAPVKYNNFAPRLGVAWDPRGNGRTSIRASYGIFYDLPMMFNESRVASSSPWGVSIGTNNFAGNLSDPYGLSAYHQSVNADIYCETGTPGAVGAVCGNPFPGLFKNTGKTAIIPNASGLLTFPAKVANTYTNQYGLSIEQQIGQEWLLKVEYLGNETTHQWAYQEIDPSIYYPGTSTGLAGSCGALVTVPASGSACSSTSNTNQRRILFNTSALTGKGNGARVGTLANLDDGATANYNGMLTTLQHRMSHNFGFLANYTYSKCISDPFTHELAGDGNAYSNPNDRRFDRGRCLADFRQIANISGSFSSPKFGSSPAVRYATGGWQLAPIFTYRSNGYFTVTTGADTALTGVNNVREIVATNQNPLLPHPIKSTTGTAGPVLWLSVPAFSAPATGSLLSSTGQRPAAVNSIPGPKFLEFDTSLSRSFAINHEKQHIEFRWEAFNVPNRVNYNNPAGSGGNLGKITSDSNSPGPRIMQFALKFNY